MNETYLSNIDTAKVEELLTSTEEKVQYFNDVSDNVVASYTQSLDELMKRLYSDVVMADNPAIDVIENYFLELTNTLYFMGEKLEHLGIYDDMSKAAYKEIYNNAYLENSTQEIDVNGKKKTPTVNDNQVAAEGVSIYENTVNSIYARAYKIVKSKIDAGYEMVKTLSKVLSRRSQELELSGMQTKNKVLNEGM